MNIFDTPKRRPVPSSENDDQETQESRRCIFNRALFCHGSRRERVIGYQLEPDSRFAEMIVAIVIVMCVFVFVCVCVCVCVFACKYAQQCLCIFRGVWFSRSRPCGVGKPHVDRIETSSRGMERGKPSYCWYISTSKHRSSAIVRVARYSNLLLQSLDSESIDPRALMQVINPSIYITCCCRMIRQT